MKKNVKVVTCTILSMMLTQNNFALFAKEEANTTKDETVYAMLHSDGSVDEEIVSSWLHNDDGIKDIKEKLDIQDVRNVKSDDEPAVHNNMYVWNSDSNDVYYEGKTKKALPIDVKVTYKLNGKPKTGEELIGQSGKLEIHIQMKNTKTKVVNINGKDTKIHPLYVGAGMVDLDTDHFKNVKINSGNIISEGNNQIVGFISVPGLEDTIKSSGIPTDAFGFSDEYIISCDTKDFALGPIMIAFTPEVSLDKLKDINSIDDLTQGLDQLNLASQQLLEGTSQLADGTNTFADKMSDLVHGVPELTDGVTTLKNGTAQLVNGSKDLNNNLSTLNVGLQQAKKGSETLLNSTKQSSDLANGAMRIDQGIGQMQTLLNEKQQEFTALLESETYQSLMNSLSLLQDLSQNITKLQTGANDINQAINDQNVQDAAVNLQKNAQETLAACQNETILDEQQCKLAKEQMLVSSTLLGTSQGVSDLNNGLQALQESTKLMSSLPEAAQQLNKSITAFQQEFQTANEQVAQLKIGSSQLVSGISTLNKGITTLDGSMDMIATGASKLYDGSKALAFGIQNADQGVSQLKNGSFTIQDGANQLYATSHILADKTKELHQGMGTFHQDGVYKMKSEVSLTMDEITQLLAIKDEIVKQAEEEHSFTGAPEHSQSSVKFIYKTEELEKEKK